MLEQVSQLLHRMLKGEPAMSVLRSLNPTAPLYLERSKLTEAVAQEVEAVEAVEIHAHCFADVYGRELMVFGIDAMLTSGYGPRNALACSPDLVAQYLTVSGESPDEFAMLPQKEQAERVWHALFISRSPLSEACRAVVTTLSALGLRAELERHDLPAIRRWFAKQDGGKFNEKVMRLAKLKYIVTSHSPFFSPVQLQASLHPPSPPPPRYKTAVEVDPLLEGHAWERVAETLSGAKEPLSMLGLQRLVRRCVEALRPQYISSSTPYGFVYVPCEGAAALDSASASLRSRLEGMPLGAGGAWPTPSEVLDLVLLPLCRELKLPLLLRMGTHRGMNPSLGMAGDGLGLTRLDSLSSLCSTHPRNKFLATVLGAAEQHQAAVTASRFRNLHLWGCWWYSHLTSVIEETSQMRLELLGTQFTYLASSAKVHDQLIAKWLRGRSLLTRLLARKYEALLDDGWKVSRDAIRRDVSSLLGGAYEEFLQKEL
jgi:hypothetical protein